MRRLSLSTIAQLNYEFAMIREKPIAINSEACSETRYSTPAGAPNKGATRKYLPFGNYRARASNFRRGAAEKKAERNRRADKESGRTFDPPDGRPVKWQLTANRRPRLITVLWCAADARRSAMGSFAR